MELNAYNRLCLYNENIVCEKVEREKKKYNTINKKLLRKRRLNREYCPNMVNSALAQAPGDVLCLISYLLPFSPLSSGSRQLSKVSDCFISWMLNSFAFLHKSPSPSATCLPNWLHTWYLRDAWCEWRMVFLYEPRFDLSRFIIESFLSIVNFYNCVNKTDARFGLKEKKSWRSPNNHRMHRQRRRRRQLKAESVDLRNSLLIDANNTARTCTFIGQFAYLRDARDWNFSR